MKSIIARAAGYDFANLWMNMAKILITLVFLYQSALVDQLGVNSLTRSQYVFTKDELSLDDLNHFRAGSNPEAPNPPRKDAVRVLTHEDPFFSIQFLPLVLGYKYESVEVDVKGIRNVIRQTAAEPPKLGDDILDQANPNRRQVFQYEQVTNKVLPEGQQTDHRRETNLTTAVFNFKDLVKEGVTLVNGEYEVTYSFRFKDIGDDEMKNSRNHHDHRSFVRYQRKDELHFEDLPVVQGRPFKIPHLLLEKINQGAKWGGWREHMEDGVAGPSILEADFKRSVFIPDPRLAPGRTYEQKGFLYEDLGAAFLNPDRTPQEAIDFVIRFLVLKNEPPRATYIPPETRDPFTVHLWNSDFFFEGESDYYYYINLSRYIIDPDGETNGQPDVRIKSLSSFNPGTRPYRLRQMKNGDWRLITDAVPDSLIMPSDKHELSVLAHDEFNHPRIKIFIQRLGESAQ